MSEFEFEITKMDIIWRPNLSLSIFQSLSVLNIHIQDDTKKRELLKNPTKIEEIQEKKLLTEIEPLQLAF